MHRAASRRTSTGHPPSPGGTPGDSSSRASKGRAVLLSCLSAFLASAAIAVVASGCSSRESQYRALSFFFDGVPDPRAPAVAAVKVGPADPSGTVAAATPVATGSVHRPYAEGLCAKCHPGSQAGGAFGGGGFGSLRSAWERCTGCHDGTPGDVTGPSVLAGGPWLHAPVAAGHCAACHEYHDSPNRSLLREGRMQGICLSCHGEAVSCGRSSAAPEADCADCHDPHGAPDAGRFFLRAPPGGR